MKFCKVRFLYVNYQVFLIYIFTFTVLGNTNQFFFLMVREVKMQNFFIKDIAIQVSCSNSPVCHSPHDFQELRFSTTNAMVSHSQLGV